MKKQFLTIQAGDEQFQACWDMTAWATFEKLSGRANAFEGWQVNASDSLDALWAAIDAAAAHHDKPAPITRRRLGTLFTSTADLNRVLELVATLVQGFMPDAEPSQGKAQQTVSSSPSNDVTSSQPVTLESQKVTSGV